MSSIDLRNVSLTFTIYDAHQRSFKNRILNYPVGGNISAGPSGHTNILALDNISAKFARGDRVALVGHNGSGKSTLLRVIAGVYVPQTGSVDVTGRISTLFNLQLGVDPTGTGFDNIYLRGLVLGFSKREIDERIDEISRFSELGRFLELPMHAYSQGMRMRLLFAISTSIRPDILLMDEWIGTGDKHFVDRAEKRLKELIGESNILVMATHNLSLAERLCNKVVLMSHGRITDVGDTEELLDLYRNTASN